MKASDPLFGFCLTHTQPSHTTSAKVGEPIEPSDRSSVSAKVGDIEPQPQQQD